MTDPEWWCPTHEVIEAGEYDPVDELWRCASSRSVLVLRGPGHPEVDGAPDWYVTRGEGLPTDGALIDNTKLGGGAYRVTTDAKGELVQLHPTGTFETRGDVVAEVWSPRSD